MMKPLDPITVEVDELIGVDKFNVDDEFAHIELAGDLASLPAEEFGKLIRVCPAGLYREEEDGTRSFNYAGCLECGTCRIACGDTIVSKWELPRPGMGVQYCFG